LKDYTNQQIDTIEYKSHPRLQVHKSLMVSLLNVILRSRIQVFLVVASGYETK